MLGTLQMSLKTGAAYRMLRALASAAAGDVSFLVAVSLVPSDEVYYRVEHPMTTARFASG